ncbi:MAG: extracellular solute-binding protein [Candidatus Bathyarchaeia archaeon]
MSKEGEVSRRRYVKYAAAGAVVVAVAGAGAYYASRPPTPTPTPTVTPTPTPTVTPTPTPTVTPTPTPTPSPTIGVVPEKRWKATKEFSGSTLRFGCSPEAFFIGIEKTIKEYMDATDVNVILESMAYEVMHEKVMMDIVAPTSFYDVWGCDSTWLGDVYEHMTPLNDWIERDNDEVQWDDFSSVGKFIPTYGDKIYGVTLGAYDCFSWYRTDILDSVGEKYPVTADKAIEILEGLGLKPNHKGIRNEITGKDDLYGFSLQTGPMNISWSFTYFLNAFGGNWIDPNTEKLAINDEVAVDALEWYKKCYDYGPPGMEAFDFTAAAMFFDSGKAVFTQAIVAEHYLALLDPSTPVYGRVANDIILQNPDPNSPARKRGIRRGTCGTGWWAGIPKNSKNKEAAWNFVKWMTDAGREYERENLDSGRESVVSALVKLPKYKMFLAHAEENRKYGGMGYPDPHPTVPELGAGATQLRTPYGWKFYDILDKHIHLYIIGKIKTAKEALDEAYKEMIMEVPELAR